MTGNLTVSGFNLPPAGILTQPLPVINSGQKRQENFHPLPKRPEFAPVLSRFSSIGVNCELGLVQRHCGVDQASLFRFGFTPLAGLLAALKDEFSQIANPDLISIEIGLSDEYITTHTVYGFECHTQTHANRLSREQAMAKVTTHFGYLSRMLMDDLKSGEKLFCHRPLFTSTDDADMRALLNAIRRFGNATLVWMEEASGKAECPVRWVEEGLMIGALDWFSARRFAAGAAYDSWLRVCTHAAALLDVKTT